MQEGGNGPIWEWIAGGAGLSAIAAAITAPIRRLHTRISKTNDRVNGHDVKLATHEALLQDLAKHRREDVRIIQNTHQLVKDVHDRFVRGAGGD